MGVFLSKPSVAKHSEDGEDDCVGYGVSSMQGWRKNMEDAHVAALNVKFDEEGIEDDSKIRLFGVFDGHGGKEVALFVQQHFAEELVKLQEYKGGDFPTALIRSFHRMDEMLEGAANELRRTQGMLPEEGGDFPSPRASAYADDGRGAKTGFEAKDGDGVGDEDGGGVAAGADGEGKIDGKGAAQATPEDSVESHRAILRELSEFRLRKNPSELETLDTPPTRAGVMRGMLSSLGNGDDGDSDDDAAVRKDTYELDVEGGGRRAGAGIGALGSSKVKEDGGSSNDEDDDDVIEISSRDEAGGISAGEGGKGRRADAKIKMKDALELFHRFLDIRKGHGSGTAGGGVGGGTGEGEGSNNPSPATDNAASIAANAANAASVTAPGAAAAASDGLASDVIGGGGPSSGDATTMARDGLGEAGTDASGGAGSSSADEEGEDTFGDSESEDDVVLTANGEDGLGPAAGARPRLGASLASMVKSGMNPTCTLEEHPIQAGCTSVVCLMAGKTLHIANAGDSRAVLCRGGVAMDLSQDHKPLSATEKARIEGAGGFVNSAGRVNGNLNLSRSIGDLKYKGNSDLPRADQMITAEPDLRSVDVTDEDSFLILACDGVWDCMTSQECVDFVGERVGNMALSKICEEVMDTCLSEDPRRTTGIGGDNMTCIVVLLDKVFVGSAAGGDEIAPAKNDDAVVADSASGERDAGHAATGDEAEMNGKDTSAAANSFL